MTENVFFAGADNVEEWKTSEQLREEGRQEILREIAAKVTDPQGGGSPIYDTACVFCGGRDYEAIPHDSNCLWLRASQVPK